MCHHPILVAGDEGFKEEAGMGISGVLKALFSGFISVYLAFAGLIAGEPEAIYLTWQEDPCHTMVVSWITHAEDDNDKLDYRRQGSDEWKRAAGSHRLLPVNNSYQVHRVVLKDLSSDSTYSFRLNSDQDKVYTFKTMRDDFKTPVRFVIGGDIYSSSLNEIGNREELYREMNQLIASYDPFCAFLGGDLAYAGNNPESFQYWLSWFKIWWQTMRGAGNRLIPMVTTLGNHDIDGAEGEKTSKLLYFAFFPNLEEGQSYYKLRFGQKMTMLLLDSGIVNDISGRQREWLKVHLSKDKDRDHLFSIYHHPAYPSVRSFNGSQAKEIRKEWVPLFEKYGLDVAFENHDHAYKRTYPLLKDQRNQDGIVYTGDGAWGVNPREPKLDREYLEKAVGARYFLLMEIEKKQRRFTAIDASSAVIDSWSMN